MGGAIACTPFSPHFSTPSSLFMPPCPFSLSLISLPFLTSPMSPAPSSLLCPCDHPDNISVPSTGLEECNSGKSPGGAQWTFLRPKACPCPETQA